MRAIFFLLLFSTLAAAAEAESTLKRLILTDCEKALVESEKTTEPEQSELIDYLNRVLLLEASSGAEASPAFDPRSHPMGIGTDDILKSFRPTKEIDAKLCAIRVAAKLPYVSAPLLPALVKLESDPLLPSDSRISLLETIRLIALKGSRADSKKVLKDLVAEMNARNGFLIESILVEYQENSAAVLAELLKGSEGEARSIAEEALILIDPSGTFAAKVASDVFSAAGPLIRGRLLHLLKNFPDVSLQMVMFAFKADPNELDNGISPVMELLTRASRDTTQKLMSDEEGRRNVQRFIQTGPVKELSRFSEILCTKGLCDQLLVPFIEQSRSEEMRTRLLTVLSAGEFFDRSLWLYAEGEAKSSSPLGLEALKGFSAKRNEITEILSNLLSQLGKKKSSFLPGEGRSLLLRSLARLLVKMAPIPARFLEKSVGEEILGLESSSEEPYLPAEAIGAFRPTPKEILLIALRSKNQGIRRQALAAVGAVKPLDSDITRRVLDLASEDSVDQASGLVSAKKVLNDLGEPILPELERVLKDPKVGLYAAEFIIKRRPTHKAAFQVLSDSFAKAKCSRKVNIAPLLSKQSLSTKNRSALWQCRDEALSNQAARRQFLSSLSPLTEEEWKTIFSTLPREASTKLSVLQDLFEFNPPASLSVAELNSILQEIKRPDETLSAIRLIKIFPAPRQEFVEQLQKIAREWKDDKVIRTIVSTLLFQSSPSSPDAIKHLVNQLSSPEQAEIIASQLTPDETLVVTRAAIASEDEDSPLFITQLLCRLGLQGAEFEQTVIYKIAHSKEEPLPELVTALSCIAPNSNALPKALHQMSLFPSWKRFLKQKLPMGFGEKLIQLEADVPSYFEKALYAQLREKIIASEKRSD